MKKGMTLQQHAEQARRIQEVYEILMEMRRTAWQAYPKRGKVNSRLDTAEKSLRRLRSELENAMYSDHPNVATEVGFPHYDPDALARLEEKADEHND